MTEFALLQDEFRGAPDSLFQSPAFHCLHRRQGEGAYLEWWDGRAVRASVHFTHVGEGLWRSPARGTFAGLWVDGELSLADLMAFFDQVEDRLKILGAQRVELLPAPEAHDRVAFAREVYCLASRGFATSVCDLNYSLEVDARLLGERMSYGNRKRLKKCEREGLVAEELPLSALPAVYEALATNRESKGYQLSMGLGQVEEMARLFPERVLLFGIPVGSTLAAAALCLRLSSRVLYVFYWGDRPGFSAASPVVALAERIYRWCHENGVAVLDVGTSTVGGEPNHGLIQFKRGLGFAESLKLRMTKTL